MINANNKPLNKEAYIDDFTIKEYQKLLKLAKKNYHFVFYDNFQSFEKFILWRHDCDYSLNRALKLAMIEEKEGVNATYFINPHCAFYNPFEKNQSTIISRIIELGHHIGIHFDSAYYDITSEADLEKWVAFEVHLFENIFNVKPDVFSFHNPNKYLLKCEKEKYGGIINCYSKKYKNEIPYISDSNGYWRFRRLKNVLQKADDKCLHVLTHPAWWQEVSMTPWKRIKLCIDGRGESILQNYEKELKKDGRLNVGKE